MSFEEVSLVETMSKQELQISKKSSHKMSTGVVVVYVVANSSERDSICCLIRLRSA